MTTTLSFDLDPVDEGVLSLLATVSRSVDGIATSNTASNLGLYIGSVTGTVASDDLSANRIEVPLPYVLFTSTLGRSTSPRLGVSKDRTVSFTLTSVRDSFKGAKAVALAMRKFLDGAAVSVSGATHTVRLLGRTEDDPRIAVDPVWSRPGGKPLFYGVDTFAVL